MDPWHSELDVAPIYLYNRDYAVPDTRVDVSMCNKGGIANDVLYFVYHLDNSSLSSPLLVWPAAAEQPWLLQPPPRE